MKNRISNSTVIEAPADVPAAASSIMLAGGSSDWRPTMIGLLNSFQGTLLNPDREPWPDDQAELRNQIAWERQSLREATLCLFWFHADTDCPNTMFEFGYALSADRPIVVGMHPQFAQKRNVTVQLSLERPELQVANTLEQLADQALSFFSGENK